MQPTTPTVVTTNITSSCKYTCCTHIYIYILDCIYVNGSEQVLYRVLNACNGSTIKMLDGSYMHVCRGSPNSKLLVAILKDIAVTKAH